MEQLIYPYTIYPYPIERILKEDFTFPHVSLKPTHPKKQDKVKKDSYSIAAIGAVLFFISLAFAVMPLLLIAILILIASCILGKSENKRINFNENQYNNELRYYHNELFKYEREIKIRNDFVNNLKRNDFREKYKLNKINEYFGSLNFTLDKRESIRGFSEKHFANLLKEVFNECKVLTNKTISKYSNNPFAPDILLFDEKSKIYIDIEIDEPYSFVEKKPIHCLMIKDNEFIHMNSDRDSYFSELGVVVIRFSESQILGAALGCIKYIADVIFTLTNSRYFFNLMNVYKFMEVSSQEFWLSEDSVKFAENKLRESQFFNEEGFENDLSKNFKLTFKESINYRNFIESNYSYNDNLDDDLPF